ncbi:hypothetical protein DAI22_11g067000 [Oryza sativa Japonica Group]|uniref:Uncharacterized protein n=1 Tax=Oryza nivara TaxID=4536 RepID=A0A0E0IZE0_ORYNI|nr:hypothetical protein DAI22_11g067000 [Oryza sativa Japonica Group]
MLHLRRRLLPLLRVPSSPHASASYYAHLRRLRLPLSTAAAATATPFSAEDYLVATCGLTGDQALKASKKISHLRSAANPDAVLAVLSGVGLSRADLAAVVASDPHLLCARPDNVSRRVTSLRDRVGLSDPQIGRFLLAGGAMAVRKCDVAERLEFWIPFLGGSFETLLKMLRRNNAIVRADVEKVIKPNIALFQESGLTVRDIVKMPGWLFTFNPKRVEAAVERTGKLGVELASSRLKYMLSIAGNITEGNASARMKYLSSTLNCSMDKVEYMVGKMPTIITLSEEKLRSKIEFLSSTLNCCVDKIGHMVCKEPFILAISEEKLRINTEFLSSALGCSIDNICVMVYKMPSILGLSVNNLCRKIEFLVTKVGLEPDYILSKPVLFACSLEKRLMPRHYIVEVLLAKGLIKNAGFLTYAILREKDFVARYIDQHKNAVPGLADAYATICSGKVPPELQP